MNAFWSRPREEIRNRHSFGLARAFVRSGELNQMGHKASHNLVAELLKDMGYSLQANQKTLEGSSHPDRNAQFEFINSKVKDYQANEQPVISVDTKKKELVGDFKNAGRELRPKGDPQKVRVHDFLIPELGRASPYGGMISPTMLDGLMSASTMILPLLQ